MQAMGQDAGYILGWRKVKQILDPARGGALTDVLAVFFHRPRLSEIMLHRHDRQPRWLNSTSEDFHHIDWPNMPIPNESFQPQYLECPPLC